MITRLRDLVERMGVVKGEDLLRVIRTIGVRRMNVFANTGQPNYRELVIIIIIAIELPATYDEQWLVLYQIYWRVP